ncbi:CAP domain-containing protein [Candidatus Parcubacteria bacterium]|nr:CAP domain-containing protein [Candidatus Parcubacteria bacterium]
MKKLGLALILIVLAGGLIKVVVLSKFDMDLAAVLPAVVAALTNDARRVNNEASLTGNALLDKAAQAKANDMATKGYFSHVSPDGTLPWQWISRAGYRYEYAGENLAVNFEDSDRVVNAWLASPTHRFNILRPQYTEIGIGTATGIYNGRQATFVVQMFANPAK